MGESASRPFGYSISGSIRKHKFCVRVLAQRLDGRREFLEIPVVARDEEVAKTEAVFLVRTKYKFHSGKALSVARRCRFS